MGRRETLAAAGKGDDFVSSSGESGLWVCVCVCTCAMGARVACTCVCVCACLNLMQFFSKLKALAILEHLARC